MPDSVSHNEISKRHTTLRSRLVTISQRGMAGHAYRHRATENKPRQARGTARPARSSPGPGVTGELAVVAAEQDHGAGGRVVGH